MYDRYLVEFRFTGTGGLSAWSTVEGDTPQTMREVVELIATYHQAHTHNHNVTNGLLRVTSLPHDAGHRDITEDALDAFGRWHLDAYDEWPWWIDTPAWVEAAA